MFKNFKKRATTVFRKKKAPDTPTDPPPEYRSVDTSTSSTLRFTSSTSTNETSLYSRRVPDPRPPETARPGTPVPPTRIAPPSPPAAPPQQLAPDLLDLQLEPELVRAESSRREDEDPVQELVTPDDDEAVPAADPFARKYVPFVEATPLKRNMLVTAGVYGSVNPAIMGGFGDDSDDDIWLVDDEESDEEQQHETRLEDEAAPETLAVTRERDSSDIRPETRSRRSERSLRSQRSGTSAFVEVPIMLAPQTSSEQLPDAPRPPSERPAFTYNRPVLLDDDEFADTTVESSPRPPTPPVIPRRGYAPLSAAILNLDDLGIDDFEEPPTETPKPRPETRRSQLNAEPPVSSSSVNPYVALFEQQDHAMTVAYLRQLDQSADDVADDFRFGQQYQKSPDTTDVIVTRQRIPVGVVFGDLECVVCTETKDVEFFPRFSITASCTHASNTCLECLQLSIESDLNSKLWTDIRCPECREPLEYTDIQRYANKQTFMRYETLALRAAMSEADNFVWCTSGCGSGQIHESGTDSPIVTCLHCRHRFCFHHNVPWHENLSCDEYDQLLADPENFRSRLELEDEAWSETQRAQLEADRALAQNMLADDQAELRRREERARQEREQAKKAAELKRKIAARLKRENEMSERMVSQTTKPCPGCGWAIEKNDGCSHMTCIKCRHEFCFECLANHRDIVAGDNSAHDRTCKFHPDNMDDDE